MRKWNSKQEVFTLNLLRMEWHNFGPTFTSEMYNIKLGAEAMRKAIIKMHVWISNQRKPR